MGSGRKALWVWKITGSYHTATKYKGNFSWEPHGSLDSMAVIYLPSASVLNLGSTWSFMTHDSQHQL